MFNFVFLGDNMMKKFKINKLNDFSILVFKIETTLSICYFSMVLIHQSTINYSQNVVKTIGVINNFFVLGVINLFMAFVLGLLFHLKINGNKKNIF